MTLEITTVKNVSKQVLEDLSETILIDSPDSLSAKLETHISKIQLKGYLNATIDTVIKNDTLVKAFINPGDQLGFINIHYGPIANHIINEKNLKSFSKNIDSVKIKIPFEDISRFMNFLVEEFEKDGNSFVRLSLKNIELIDQEAYAQLSLYQNIVRHIDKVIVKGYENFPKNYIEHDLQLKRGDVFNKGKIDFASRALNTIPFASEQKTPEVLFTNDSTIVYLYLNKQKSNQFDGIIGFASKENDDGIEFNGYLDLSINNIFNSGETIALYWKSNGQNRQRFYLDVELPYLFNLPLTPKVNFELYRQDSTFNNVKADVSLKYKLKNAGLIAAHLNTENSNDLTNGESPGVASYSNLFYGLSYSFNMLRNDALFPVIFEIGLTGLLGSRDDDIESTSQTKFTLTANYLYSIDQKNYIFLQNSSGILNSDDYFENELFRIGGIYNLRGVNEESIFASAFSIFNLEYRFRPNPSSYFYSITDFAYISNDLLEENTNVFSLGLGYAFQTKAGILNLGYAIGKYEDSPFSFDNSKVHIKIISNF